MGTFYNPDRDITNIKLRYPKEIKYNGEFIAGKFMKYLLAQGLDKKRVVKFCRYAKVVSEWLNKPFDQIDEEDIEEFLAIVNTSKYAEWTKMDIKLTMRKILQCLGKEELDKFTLTIKRHEERLPEILSEDTIKKMVQVASEVDWRDAALLGVAYETAARPNELQSMLIKDVVETPYGFRVSLKGKTGERRLPVVLFASTLKKWLMIHPFAKDPEKPVFCSLASNYLGEFLSYSHFSKIFKKYAKKAGVKNGINPYIFRHSRLTVMAKHMTEAELCEFAGWIQGSKMARVYVHLSGRDIEDKYLQIYGLKEREDENNKTKLVTCMRCQMQNNEIEKFCVRCGYPLTSEAAREVLEGDVFKQELKKMLKELIG